MADDSTGGMFAGLLGRPMTDADYWWLKKTPPVPFDPLGSGYDYATAQAAGLQPDATGHWPSRDPRTGMILKGATHPTFPLTTGGEELVGNEMAFKEGRYFSNPPLGPLGRPETFEDTTWRGGDVSGTPRIAPPTTPEQNFGAALGKIAAEPEKNVVYNRLSSAGQAVADAINPAIPPELRGKVGAVSQAVESADPIRGGQRFGVNVQQGEYGKAALELASMIPLEAPAAIATKVAAAAAAKPAMFLAAGAAGADLKSLALAKRMAKQGATPEAIWNATTDLSKGKLGWFQGKDGKWRFEISDLGSSVNMDRLRQAPQFHGWVPTEPGLPMSEVFNHPELYKNVPDAANWQVYRATEDVLGGPGARGGFLQGHNKMILNEAMSPEMMRSVVLHEGTHGVQGKFKFAPGASPRRPEVIRQANKIRPAVEADLIATDEAYRVQMQDWVRAKYGPDVQITPKRVDEWIAANPELGAAVEENYRKMQQPARWTRHHAYETTAGEVEPRNVQERADYTMEQRAGAVPTSTERVPRDQQWTMPIKRGKRTTGDTAADMVMDTGEFRPAAIGHNQPPTGSMNPLDDVPLTFRGKEPAQWTPEDWKAAGEHYKTDKPMGPLSPLVTYKDKYGKEVQIPGGTEGEFTYYDQLWMKANGINPERLNQNLHAQIQAKLGRTMTPVGGEPSDAQVWQGLIFGMTSPNNPLFPNQMASSRLRLRDPQLLDDLAGMIPKSWGKNPPTREARLAVSDAIASRYGLQSAEAGGLGVRGTTDYSRLAELAQMFKENPAFFRKLPNESWEQAVERIASQVQGLSMKTGSLGTVWQDPANAAISAIDRHMARELERRGGLFTSPEERAAWQDRSVNLWNQRELKRVADQKKENMQLAAKGKPVSRVAPADLATDFADMASKSGSDGHIGEMLLSHVGNARNPLFRLKSGEINPTMPAHLAFANWAREPEKVLLMGDAYRRALELNQKLADRSGLKLFMSQWMHWDRIRNRLEPHENMFPGLEKMPAMSMEQLRAVDAAHRETGHKVYDLNARGRLPPTKPLQGSPSRMGYMGLAGTAGLGGLIASSIAGKQPDDFKFQ